MTYRKILVAVDTTDEADHILDAAKEVLNGANGTISIVSVIKPLTGFYVDMYSVLGDIPDVESQAVTSATTWLSDWICHSQTTYKIQSRNANSGRRPRSNHDHEVRS